MRPARRVGCKQRHPARFFISTVNLALAISLGYRGVVRFLLLLAAVPALAGCGDIFGDKDAHQPGEALGTFHVVGTRASSTCGEGALGSGPNWEFDVELAREGDTLYWDNGAQIVVGALAADGVSFLIETGIVVDMRTEETLAYGPCSLERRDAASGALEDEGEEGVTGFSATLSYSFSPTADSECWDLIEGEAPTFAALPCSMSYALEAARTATPE